jgi:transcriptional regulator with XRE-family HTH domain
VEGFHVTTDRLDADALDGGPTVARMLVGAELRRLREAAGVSREQAGYEIRGSDSKISRMELGRVRFKVRDVDDLLTLYGVADRADRAVLLEQAERANQPGWWQIYHDVTPTWFQSYLGLESAASIIRTYEVQFVPGLLQTENYARAGVRRHHPAEVERRVELRMRRQQVLDRDKPPQLWAVVDEAALRRPIGGRQVMREQIEALVAAARRPRVRLQIIPFEAGGHAAAGGAFTLLRFPAPDMPDVIYLEQLTGASYLDKRDDVEHYSAAMERLSVEAEPPGRTDALLEDILKDFA